MVHQRQTARVFEGARGSSCRNTARPSPVRSGSERRGSEARATRPIAEDSHAIGILHPPVGCVSRTTKRLCRPPAATSGALPEQARADGQPVDEAGSVDGRPNGASQPPPTLILASAGQPRSFGATGQACDTRRGRGACASARLRRLWVPRCAGANLRRHPPSATQSSKDETASWARFSPSPCPSSG